VNLKSTCYLLLTLIHCILPLDSPIITRRHRVLEKKLRFVYIFKLTCAMTNRLVMPNTRCFYRTRILTRSIFLRFQWRSKYGLCRRPLEFLHLVFVSSTLVHVKTSTKLLKTEQTAFVSLILKL
jgi:hypothetical protein